MEASLPWLGFTIPQDAVLKVEILNQAIKHRVHCFVFTSSIAVYGSINVPWLWKPFTIFTWSWGLMGWQQRFGGFSLKEDKKHI
jgi:nucleoside-diphosphate-sugar epimerase